MSYYGHDSVDDLVRRGLFDTLLDRMRDDNRDVLAALAEITQELRALRQTLEGRIPRETSPNPSVVAPAPDVTDEYEEQVSMCIEIMRQERKCSISMLQKRLRLGYTRMARLMEILEDRGIVAPPRGDGNREILADLNAMP